MIKMKAANLLEKVSKAKNPSQSNFSTRLLQLGGAGLVLGRLGYLWYRKTTRKRNHELKSKEFGEAVFKVSNKLFPEFYSLVRKSNFEVVVQVQSREDYNQSQLDVNNPVVKDLFYQAGKEDRERLSEAKFFGSLVKLGFENLQANYLKYKQEEERIAHKFKSKMSLNEDESKIFNISFYEYHCPRALLIAPFQNFMNIQEHVTGLDHKECLQRLFNYETETIKIMMETYSELVLTERCLDMRKREEEYDKIFQERVRMQPLQDYVCKKLEAAGRQALVYNPLILLLSRALTPPDFARYSKIELDMLFTNLIFDPQICFLKMFTRVKAPKSVEPVKETFLQNLQTPAIKLVLEKTGLKYTVFNDKAELSR